MAEVEVLDLTPNKRDRSPSFPYLDLNTSLEYLKKLYRVAKMTEVRSADVANAWGMAPLSGTMFRYLSSLGQYGLIDSSGSGESRKHRVSAQARRILEDDRPGVRKQLLSDAALQPKLIRGLFLGEDGLHTWGNDRPSDAIAESYLKFELQFGSDAAKRLISVYDSTILSIVTPENPIFENGTSLLEDAPSVTQMAKDSDPVPANVAQTQVAQANQQPLTQAHLNQIVFKSEGAGVISIVATLDAEGLDILAKKIEAFKMLLS